MQIQRAMTIIDDAIGYGMIIGTFVTILFFMILSLGFGLGPPKYIDESDNFGKLFLIITITWIVLSAISSVIYYVVVSETVEPPEIVIVEPPVTEEIQPPVTEETPQKEIDPCQGIVCQHGGTCENGVCIKCQDGHTGDLCEIPPAAAPAITGPPEVVDPCASVVCQHGGTCENGVCINCQDNFTGDQCEVPPDPCAGVVCQHGGTCKNGVCECPPNYSGPFCDQHAVLECNGGDAPFDIDVPGKFALPAEIVDPILTTSLRNFSFKFWFKVRPTTPKMTLENFILASKGNPADDPLKYHSPVFEASGNLPKMTVIKYRFDTDSEDGLTKKQFDTRHTDLSKEKLDWHFAGVSFADSTMTHSFTFQNSGFAPFLSSSVTQAFAPGPFTFDGTYHIFKKICFYNRPMTKQEMTDIYNAERIQVLSQYIRPNTT